MNAKPSCVRKLALFSSALLTSAGTIASAQDQADPWFSITGEELADLIETLASDEFEGRESGTEGGHKTTRFLAEQFAALGLEPAVRGSYFQPVPLVKLTRQDPGDMVMRVGGRSVEFAPSAEFITFPGSSNGGGAVADAPLVFVGHGITAPEFDWDDYSDADVRGKVVVILRGEPMRDGDDSFFMGRELTDHYQIANKMKRAAENGALGAILVHTEASAGWPWSLLAEGSSSFTQMMLDKQDDSPKLVVNAQVSEVAAKKLVDAAGGDFDALVARAATTPGATPLDATLSMGYRGVRSTVTSDNVIGKITGSEAPDECVIYTAHWDHVGVDPKARGDGVHNGAVDNATGTAALIEIAEAFRMMDPAPRRTVVFVATAAEEKGLYGAEHYITDPVCSLGKTAAVLNMDSHFPFGPQKAMTVPGFGFVEVQDFFIAPAGRAGRVLQADTNPEVGGFFRNDAYPFIAAGVPAIYAVGSPLEAELTPESAILAKYIDYVTKRYHKPADEFDRATWDMRGMEQDFRIFFDAGRSLAQTHAFPNFRRDLPWRKLRDEMREETESE